jgi:ferredoxin
MNKDHTGEWMKKVIKDFIQSSGENNLRNRKNEKAWDEPLVGFASGADPIFEDYKEYVGPFHLTPHEVFSKIFPSLDLTPEELTVISWILPQTEATKIDNRRETLYPSERWARARIFGEEANVKLGQQVVAVLQADGHEAVAPHQSPVWERKLSERYGFASTWSERHAAYAAGLGTFGLCDGLITPKGKAMRCGSVIANIQTSPTVRSYQNHHEYCLYYSTGKCKKCMQRCPARAITEAGHDKERCRGYLRPATAEYVETHYNFKGYGCGLCQTGVPCESAIPTINDIG